MYATVKNEALNKDVSWSKGKYFALWLCIIGFVYNLFNVTNDYFCYNTEIETIFVDPYKLDLPAITICTPEGFTHTKKDLRSSYPQLNKSIALIENSNATDVEKMIWKANNYTIFQLRSTDERNVKKLFANTIQSEDIVMLCIVFTPTYWDKKHNKGYPLSNCVWMVEVLQSLVPDSFGKCFTFLSQLNTRIGDKTRFQIPRKSTSLIKLFVKMDLFDDKPMTPFIKQDKDRLYLFVHQANSLPSFDYMDAIELESGFEYDISFSQTKKKYLPNPYNTNCFEYSKHLGDGYEHCINKCNQQRIKKILDCIPFVKSLSNDNELQNSNDKVCGYFESRMYYSREDRYCRKSCKIDCTQTRYQTNSFKKANIDGANIRVTTGSKETRVKKLSIVDIRHRITDDIEYIYKPLLTFNQYLLRIIILSVIWLGLSAFSSLSIIENSFKRAKNLNSTVNDKVTPTLIQVAPNTTLETLDSNAKLEHYNNFIAKVYAYDEKYPQNQKN